MWIETKRKKTYTSTGNDSAFLTIFRECWALDKNGFVLMFQTNNNQEIERTRNKNKNKNQCGVISKYRVCVNAISE